jgi:HEAT repeat protein
MLAVFMIVLIALVTLGGCSTPQEKKSLQELIDQQTPILKELASYQSERQRRAVNRFLKLGKNQGTEVAVWFLDDAAVADNERVRVLLAWILSSWDDRRGMPFLLDSLESRDLGVLRLAQEGLANYGPDDVLARRLGEVLGESKNADARLSAAIVLSDMKTVNALDILGSHLKGKEESEREVRGICLLGVVNSSPSHARLTYLVDSLTDPDVEIRERAWDALKKEDRFWKVVNSPKKTAALYHPASEPADMVDSIASIRGWLKKYGARIY